MQSSIQAHAASGNEINRFHLTVGLVVLSVGSYAAALTVQILFLR
jgi:hypothetical protein